MAAKEDKAKVRIVFMEFEGSNEALQNTVRDITKAITPPARVISRQIPGDSPPAGALGYDQAEPDTEDAEFEEVESKSTEPKNKRVRKPPQVEIIEDLDLGSGDPNLKTFFEDKGSPTENTARYLVMMKWLKDTLNIPEITIHHIHTCHRFLKLSTPPYPGTVFNDMMKSDRNYITRANRGAYRINLIGERKVDELGAGHPE